MISDEVARIVRYCRKQSGLSQKELAKLADVGKTVVFDLEKGKKTVQFNTLIKILDVLNIQIKFELPIAQPMDDDS